MTDKSQKKPNFFARVANTFKRIAKYFRDTFGEMKKVAWPSKKQVVNNTIVVLVVVVFAAVIIFGLDTLFGFILQTLLNIVN